MFQEKCKKAIGQSNISPTLLSEFRMIIPPIESQRSYGRIVQRSEQLRDKQCEAERQAEHLFQTLLHRAFRGELWIGTPDRSPKTCQCVCAQVAPMPTKPLVGRYDEQRVARLKPVRVEIEKLHLPPLRFRKFNSILNALEVQIEDGLDMPEAKRLLIEALRAAVQHEAGGEIGKSAMHAIDIFEQADQKP